MLLIDRNRSKALEGDADEPISTATVTVSRNLRPLSSPNRSTLLSNAIIPGESTLVVVLFDPRLSDRDKVPGLPLSGGRSHFCLPTVPVPQFQFKRWCDLSCQGGKIGRTQVQYAEAPPASIDVIKSRFKQARHLAGKESYIERIQRQPESLAAGFKVSLFHNPASTKRLCSYAFWNRH
jgi:hypothetical protein